MKRKNGFISMSIIYSFFAVFAIVSTSLLLVYSNNIAIVKNINKEVKEELNKKGNDMILVFDNLIIDGSIEEGSSTWVNIPNANSTTKYGNPLSLRKEQQYYRDSALAMTYSDTTRSYLIRTNRVIDLIQNHYYYISRVYESWNHTLGNMLYLYFMVNSQSGNFKADNSNVINNTRTYDIIANARGYTEKLTVSGVQYNNVYTTTDISSSRNRRESGWCVGNMTECKAGTYANTLESGIFKFDKPTGKYYLVTGANFTNWNTKSNPFRGMVNGNATYENIGKDDTDCATLCGVPPRYYTDGYMLFDLTVAFQLTDAQANTYIAGSGNSKLACNAKRIDQLLDGRYYEGRKEFASHRLNITLPC